MSSANSSRRIRAADLQVDPDARPGWEIAEDRIPPKGERVYCTEGEAEVARVCGKTSDGGRILELRILDRQAPPFFAAASNVLVRTQPKTRRTARRKSRDAPGRK